MQHICNIAGIIAAVAWETHSEVTLEERLAIITLRSALAPINCSRVGLSEEDAFESRISEKAVENINRRIAFRRPNFFHSLV